VLAFRGGLGAGKTCMCRGIARGLGIKEAVSSPSYTLINEYDGRLPFYHFDAYRLESAEELVALDSDSYFYGNGVCAVEWSERVASAIPDKAAVIELEIMPDGSRRISLMDACLEKAISDSGWMEQNSK